MRIDDLGRELKQAYESAPQGERVVAIHLFGIKYAREIGSSSKAVIAASGLPVSYATEVAKGVKLAPHVELRSR